MIARIYIVDNYWDISSFLLFHTPLRHLELTSNWPRINLESTSNQPRKSSKSDWQEEWNSDEKYPRKHLLFYIQLYTQQKFNKRILNLLIKYNIFVHYQLK